MQFIPSTEFSRQCMVRGITTAWLAEVTYTGKPGVRTWRQGTRLPPPPTLVLLSRRLWGKFKWDVTPDQIVKLMQTPAKNGVAHNNKEKQKT